MNIRHLRFIFLSLLLAISGSGFSYAQESKAIQSDTTGIIDFIMFPASDPFTKDEPIEINLSFNVKEFIKTKYKPEYQDAVLSVTDQGGSLVEQNVRIKARGEFRKQHCSFPPIKLNLKNASFADQSLNNVKTLKLVTHCKNSKSYEQYILKEYLIYRMYNLFTDFSYRVRLFKINYIDTQGKSKTHTSYGFIIESHTLLAERTNSTLFETEQIPSKLADHELAHLMFIFQYMIGNTDWSIPALHNIRLFKILSFDKENPVAVPYDFDYSGMVNAYYAIPDEKLGIESIRERIYRGYCIPDAEYEPVFRKFLDAKEDIYALVENFEFLDKTSKKDMITYMDEFYSIIENPRSRKFRIIDNCLQ